MEKARAPKPLSPEEKRAWRQEMERRKREMLTYFHSWLHSPEAAPFRREFKIVWDAYLEQYLFPSMEVLRFTQARCRREDEAQGALQHEDTTNRKKVFSFIHTEWRQVGSLVCSTPARIAQGYPARMIITGVKVVNTEVGRFYNYKAKEV